MLFSLIKSHQMDHDFRDRRGRHAINQSLFAPTTLQRQSIGWGLCRPIRFVRPRGHRISILRHRVDGYRAGDLDANTRRLMWKRTTYMPTAFSRGRCGTFSTRARTRGCVRSSRRCSRPFAVWEKSIRRRSSPSRTQARHQCLGRILEGHDAGARRPALSRPGTDCPPGERHQGLQTVSPPASSRGASATTASGARDGHRRHLRAGPRKDLARCSRPLSPSWQRSRMVKQLVTAGELHREPVDGMSYVWPAGDSPTRRAAPRLVRFLAPFDPVVWDRVRFEHLWGWPYRFEAYTPDRETHSRLLCDAHVVG